MPGHRNALLLYFSLQYKLFISIFFLIFFDFQSICWHQNVPHYFLLQLSSLAAILTSNRSNSCAEGLSPELESQSGDADSSLRAGQPQHLHDRVKLMGCGALDCFFSLFAPRCASGLQGEHGRVHRGPGAWEQTRSYVEITEMEKVGERRLGLVVL